MRTRSHQFSSPRASRDSNSPVPSTWPCTMWPLRRPVGASGRSRFTREPARRSPRLLRRRVSGAKSAEKPSGRRPTAVRHTPLTATLAPSVMSSRTVEQCTLRRPPWRDATVPSSSMIPVNIQVSFHRELVRRDLMNGDAMDADGVGAAAAPDAAGERQGLEAAKNFGAVIEEDAIGNPVFESAPIDLAAGFDHQGQVLFG